MEEEGPKTKIPKLAEDTEAEEIETESIDPNFKPSSTFESPWHHSDVVLDIEGHHFHVHKCILSMNSLFFETMFKSDFKEKSAAQVPLPGKSAKQFEVLLKMIYSEDKKSMITYENFEFLVKLADEYQMVKIKKICVDFMKSTLDDDNCLHFCQVADQFGLEEEIIQKCVEQAKYLPFSTFENSEHFAQISSAAPFTLDRKILIEKIKVLEKYKKLLDRYHSTCRDLVKSIYYLAASKVTICCNAYFHHFTKETRDNFVYDCASCISILEKNWPSHLKPYNEIGPNIKLLRSQTTSYQNQVHRKRSVVFHFN